MVGSTKKEHTQKHMSTGTTPTPKPPPIERWENEGGDVPPSPKISPVEELEERGRRKRLVVFDLNGTLCEANEPLDEEMADLFSRLLCLVKVAVLSGRDDEDTRRQLLAPLETAGSADALDHLTVLAASGSKLVHAGPGWNRTDVETLTPAEKDEILRVLRESLAETNFETVEVRGEQIIDCGSQITFCALGTGASPVERASWDPDHTKRLRLKSAFDALCPDYSVRLSGMTSLDITRVGADKSFGIRQLRENLHINFDEMLFVGASLFPAGNDHPVHELGVLTIQVNHPDETKRVIETMLACLCGIEEERPALSAEETAA